MKKPAFLGGFLSGAKDGIRTRDPDLGKVVLYQLSYSRLYFKSSSLRLKENLLYRGSKFKDFFCFYKYCYQIIF